LRKGRVFIVSGPSGVGKTTIVKALLKQLPTVSFSVSYTTRRKRRGEVEGRDYHFINKKQFKKLLKEGEFLEHAIVHGHYYGTSIKEIKRKLKSKDVILDIDVQGARQIKRKKENKRRSLNVSVFFFFILPPSMHELIRRIEMRGTEDRVQRELRIKAATREIKAAGEFDCLVVNDDLDKTVAVLKEIIILYDYWHRN
jgi:guanylate kinase